MSTALAIAPPDVGRRPDEGLYEVVDGVRVEKPVSAASVWIASRLDQRLGPFVDANRLGTSVTEMVFVLDTERDLRRRPDVGFVSVAKWPVGKMPPYRSDWKMVPDLAIEVLSPNNRYIEVVQKLHEYFEYGVREVWLVLPEQQLVEIYQSPTERVILRAGDTLQTSLVPGWSMQVSALIPEMDDAETAAE